MKSVCFLVQNHYDLDVRVRRKAEALTAAGFDVDVLSLGSSQQPRNYVLHGVNVCRLALGKKRGSLARYGFEYLVFFLWATFRLTLQMSRKRYVAVDVNTLPDFLVFAGVFAKWMGAKLILDMHEITPEFYMSKYGMAEGSLAVRILRFVERISFQFADHVITINAPIQSLLESRGLVREKSSIITNGADEAHFAKTPRPCPSADAAAASARFVMMYHGTLTRIYGLDIAIDAFAIAHNEMPGAEFWILGGGTELDALKAQVERLGLGQKVRLIGMVQPADIPSWLSKCDLGILPIRRDVFLDYASPNKLAEYIIMGKAVVISRLKAIQHYFSENALALCEPNNPSDLARQMVRLYRDPGLRARLAERASEEYMPIRWSVTKERYVKFMQDVAGIVIVPAKQSDPALIRG